jgi:hypothetical protein
MKEYCIFNKQGKLVFTINTLLGMDMYKDESKYTIIESEKLDSMYSYSLIDGEIVKGDAWPIPEPINN